MESGLTEEYRAEQSRHWLRQEVSDGLIDLCQGGSGDSGSIEDSGK
ncbi:MAG: hypothetical protein Ct9H300mP14_08240 [Gammaproteobacteria bacterium]|nr:MAG: hypothetical protein Ct9H300mP14_08240 [Gammaproteobacteria bacterium]